MMKIKHMKVTCAFLAIFLVMSVLFIAGCGSTTTPASQNTGIQGTETTKNSAPDGTQATDTSSVDQLNQDLNTADIDNIDVTVDESTFS